MAEEDADEFGDFSDFSAFESATFTAATAEENIPQEEITAEEEKVTENDDICGETCEAAAEGGSFGGWNAFADNDTDDGHDVNAASDTAWASFPAQYEAPTSSATPQFEDQDCVELGDCATLVNDYVLDELLLHLYDMAVASEQCESTSLLQHLEDNVQKCEPLSVNGASELYSRIRIVEETPALSYQWGDKTQIFQSFLNALSIDYNLAKMRNSNLPAFAQHLGMTLTPLKGADSPQLTLQSQPTTIDSLSVPPAQFDWSNSGLTNPLTGVSSTSAILDLDYLSSTDLKSSGKTNTLQRDLESLGLADTDSPPAVNGYVKCDALQKVLKDTSKLTWNAHKNDPSSQVTMADPFPDLSYMLSPVLVFPVKPSK